MDLFEREFDEHLAVAAATRAAWGRPSGACWMPGSPAFAAAARSCSSAMAAVPAMPSISRPSWPSAIAKDRAPIAAIALTTDSSALTAAGNDWGSSASSPARSRLSAGRAISPRHHHLRPQPQCDRGAGDGEDAWASWPPAFGGGDGGRAARASPIPCSSSPPGQRRASRRCISPSARCSAPGSSRSWVWYERGSNPGRAAWPRPASWCSAM